jgi:hypothetical protein
MKKLCFAILLLFPLSVFSQGLDQHINIHFYPHPLSPQDCLQDGPYGEQLDISDDQFLVWVDLFPGMFFCHETAYILISKENVRIVKGDWWPVLNGKMILHNEHDKYALISPFELPLISRDGFIDNKIVIHVYPHELTAQDKLQDGPQEELFKIDDNSLLIWVDFLPYAFFAHPTAYILISGKSIRYEKGSWWPNLNGKTILYGESNKIGILSPFRIAGTGNILERRERSISSPRSQYELQNLEIKSPPGLTD